MTPIEHVYGICCRPEAVGDVISRVKKVATAKRYALLNFEAASISSFREKQNQPFVGYNA